VSELHRRIGAVAVGAAAVLLGTALPASAHVTVTPAVAAQGGFAKLAFRVPNEKIAAMTSKIEIVFPASQPLASVSVRPVAGWIPAVTRVKLDQPITTGEGDEVS
jgi:uncharacterized protein YcnI